MRIETAKRILKQSCSKNPKTQWQRLHSEAVETIFEYLENLECFEEKESAQWLYHEESDFTATIWYYECSECGYKTVDNECYELPKFCPCCGCSMEY